jgi:hypothetical protein
MSEGHFDRKQVIINSQFREASSTSASDFTWRFEERIEGVRHAELRYFIFENGAYNITASNNTFELQEYATPDGTGASVFVAPVNVVVPVGAYDDTSLSSAIGLAMVFTTAQNNGSNLYFVSFDGQGRISMTCSAGRSFEIIFPNTTLGSNTALTLGFLPNSTQDSWTSGVGYTILAPNPQQLTNYDYLIVKSQKLGNDISFMSATGVVDQSAVIPPYVKNTPFVPPYKSATSCFAIVPNNYANTGGSTYSIVYEQLRPPQITTLKHPYSLDYIDIQVCDKYGQVIDSYTNNITLGIELFLDKKSESRSTTERSGGGRGDCMCRGCSGC